jgi:NAD(P)-dependent dehydrogenase (short-subunit alcohol dehydrogenase family)
MRMAEIKRVAIVTGSSRGIGRNVVMRLAERGISSIVTYRSKHDEAERVVSAVRAAGVEAVALQLDVGAASSFDTFVARVREELPGLGVEGFDYLVNNAGVSSTATLANGTEADLDLQFAVHFKGPFLLTQKLLPLLNDGGSIVNISSGLARVAYPGRSIYGPMKAAVEALTRYMALELGQRRITVNVVAPGAIATDFSGGIVRDNPEVAKAVAAQAALGRVGLPEDVGPVIASLLSAEFGWVNAQRIEVAGGIQI